MKIKISAVEKFIIYFLILCNLSILKVFPFFTESIVHLMTLILILMLLAYNMFKKKNVITDYYMRVLAYFIVFFMVEFFYTIIIFDYSFAKCFKSVYVMFYILLAPILLMHLRRRPNWLITLIRFIIFFTVVSALMRIMLSNYYGRTGNYLFSDMAFEFNDGNWMRNGILRVMMPCFSSLFIPLFVWEFTRMSQKIKLKLLYLICFAVVEYFIFYILQARSVMVYYVLVGAVMFFLKKKSRDKQFVLFGIIIAVAIVILNSQTFADFIKSFDSSNSLYGGSTWARFAAIDYYYQKFLHNPILGCGFLSDVDMQVGLPDGHISDIGILGGLFRYGILGFGFYLMFFIRWVKIVIKLYKNKENQEFLLAVGILLSVLMFGVSIDCMYGAIIFAMPFASAILEYLYVCKPLYSRRHYEQKYLYEQI